MCIRDRCDRKAAQIKSHVKSYVNEGHSVTNVRELKQAIESRGGIPGVRVTVVKVQSKSSKSYKLDGVSSLNNFKFTNGGFKAFRAYDLGPGKFFPWGSFESGIVRSLCREAAWPSGQSTGFEIRRGFISGSDW